jgi:predicted transcriptional regulator
LTIIEKTLLHRSRIDIIANILNTAEHGAKKTHIMYQCNLSYRQLTGYLQLLDDMNLLTRNPKNPNTYQVTQKGKNFTQAYKNMKAILDTKP